MYTPPPTDLARRCLTPQQGWLSLRWLSALQRHELCNAVCVRAQLEVLVCVRVGVRAWVWFRVGVDVRTRMRLDPAGVEM
jgi:hypothetical protein